MLPATPPILITTLNGIGLGGFKIKGKFQVSKITTSICPKPKPKAKDV